MGWIFPIMIALMFGMFFGGAIRVPEDGNYFEFLMPGMFTTTMFFGLESTVLAVTTDASKGVTDRFRSLPIHASTIVLGRCIVDMLNSLIGLLLLMGLGFLLGWRSHAGIGGTLAGVGLLLCLRFALLWVGIYLGILLKKPESVVIIQILVWPVSFLSNAFVDASTMPAWLGVIAQWNPLSITTTAIRQLFVNPGWQTSSWNPGFSWLMALLVPLLITAIFFPLSTIAYRRLNR
jgi:ABC-2 type transport system permease protein